MKKIILFLALVIISHSIIISQGCLPEGITFTTQEQIDNFQVNYPGCTEIEGDVEIGALEIGSEINDLAGLYVLTFVHGDIVIQWNTALENLIGLNNLDSVGGNLLITENYVLDNLSGVENIKLIRGNLEITNNTMLTNVDGLTNLVIIYGGLYIYGNPSLNSISGFHNILSIGDDLHIWYTEMLTNLNGLENITSIGGDLDIHTNSSLSTLIGLDNLTMIGGRLDICNNSNITNLSGIKNVTFIGGELLLYYNPLLSVCDVQSICNYLAEPSGPVTIHSNASGCNSTYEVQQHCLTSLEEIMSKDEVSIFPNPATESITITVQGVLPIEEAIIYNHLGQKALDAKPVNNTLDISKLKPGIYMLEVATKEWMGRTKLMIE